MGLIFKTVKSIQRSMYLYYPDIPTHNHYVVRLITVIRGDASEESVNRLLDAGLRELAEKNRLILAFPNPLETGWNDQLSKELPDDLSALDVLLRAVSKPDDDPIKLDFQGIPALSEMLRQWHAMNNFRYVIGIDGGASMAYAYAAMCPENITAVWGIGGALCREALRKGSFVPVTAVLSGASEETRVYFMMANKAYEAQKTASGRNMYVSTVNPCHYVLCAPEPVDFKVSLNTVYEKTFAPLKRLNTGRRGENTTATDLSSPEFTWVLEDERLGDHEKHTWLTHVPSNLPEGKVPLVLFCHGGSDNPSEAAQMSKFHELGSREGFITVYPWGTDTASWNVNLEPTLKDDDGFLVRLIDYMIANYPVDPERVYISGFSNGAGIAQVTAMLHPEKIACLIHIDSNWPGNRLKANDLDIMDVPPMKIALTTKDPAMRMPVWYTYGSRELSYPVIMNCSQQKQYDFWKQFNNMEVKPTPAADDDCPVGCGILGDETLELHPSEVYPDHLYEVQRFYTKDETPEPYYNYCMMHDKGHEVAPSDPMLAYNFAKQFKRNPDGSVGRV